MNYTCSGFCKTSYHLSISPPPTNLPKSLPAPYHSTYHALQQQRVTLERNKIDRKSRMWCQYTCYFPAKGSTNPKGNHPSKFQLAGVRSFGGVREQTNKQTESLTAWCFERDGKQIEERIIDR